MSQSIAWNDKSTNVRATHASRLLTVARLVARIAPGAVAWFAARRFFTPPRRRAGRRTHPPPGRGSLGGEGWGDSLGGGSFEVRSGGNRIRGRAFGAGPRVYLVHGWGGTSGQFRTLVPTLMMAGLSPVVFDAPAHGASTGRRTNLVEMAAALRAVVDRHGPAHAVVAHSLGGAAAVLALSRGLPVGRVVLLGVPADPLGYFRAFLDAFGVPAPQRAALEARLETRFSFEWSELALPNAVRRLDAPALVVHDREDAAVPVHDGEVIARSWPNAALLLTTGLGHRAILHDAAMITRVVRFLRIDADASHPGCASGRCAGAVRCEQCELEQELWAPPRRWPTALAA